MRRTTSLHLPDGRSVWFDGARLLVAGPDDEPTPLPWKTEDRPVYATGFGLRVMHSDGRGRGPDARLFYDLARRRVVEFDGSKWDPRIRPRDWLVRGSGSAKWEILEPDSGTRRPALGFRPEDQLGPMLADGSFLVYESETPNIAVVDPDTGTRRAIPFDDGWSGAINGVSNARWGGFRSSLRAPHGSDVLLVGIRHRGVLLARFDGERLTRCAIEADRFILAARDGEDSVVVIRNRRTIERLYFGSERREVLFPR